MRFGEILTPDEEADLEKMAEIIYNYSPIFTFDPSDEDEKEDGYYVEWKDVADNWPATYEAAVEAACQILGVIFDRS